MRVKRRRAIVTVVVAVATATDIFYSLLYFLLIYTSITPCPTV